MELTFNELPQAVTELQKSVNNIERLLLIKISESQPQSDKLLSIQEAAKFLNLSVATIYSKVSLNQLPFMKRSRKLYFSKQELTDYLKAGRNQTKEEIEENAVNSFIKRKGAKL
jgi:excisionase family DNA binding protein